MEIENKHTLVAAFKSGINIFVGAGFSLYAKDAKGRTLPKGDKLLEELKPLFTKGQTITDLPRFCSIAQREDRNKLTDYLTERFTVTEFDPCYLNLNLLNMKGAYTTNIDNLLPQIIQKSTDRYVHNQKTNGECTDSKGVNYLPIHGNVEEPECGYIFDVSGLATIFNDSQKVMNYLTSALEKYPTLFIGYGMNDSSVIQAMVSNPSFNNIKKERWAVLYKPDEDTIEFYRSFDFKIIIAETKEFLDYLATLDLGTKKESKSQKDKEQILSAYLVPRDDRNLPKRAIVDFFRGQPPFWTDILGNKIHKTSYYSAILDSVSNPHKHTIITGAPVSGKTTLAMQICQSALCEGYKLYFKELTLGRSEFIKKIIADDKALICVESFSDDIDAFLNLAELPHVQLVGIDRSHTFGSVEHKFSRNQYDVINVTEIPQSDLQSVFDTLPTDVKKGKFELAKNNKDPRKNTIFEFVLRNIKGQTIKQRYQRVIRDLEDENPDLAQFLLLSAYMSHCHVPLSMEVAYSFFYDLSYTEVLNLSHNLQDFLAEHESSDMMDLDIEYYVPRSFHMAETILNSASQDFLRDVVEGVVNNVPTITICNYATFRRNAFDKELISRIYPRWQEGMAFFEKAFLYDNNNPYVLQQGALYLSSKHQYSKAFEWIDRAQNLTSDKYFSIRNSHAIIMFDANYNVMTKDAEEQLDKSMAILVKCFNDDHRKIFHVITYANQALRYHARFNNEHSITYLRTAAEWLRTEKENAVWKYELKELEIKISNVLSLIS